MRYLKGTENVGLEYCRRNEQEIVSFVDSDWGSDRINRKSVTGFVIKVFGNVVTWVTRKQNCITLSTTEAELVALCACVTES